MTRDADQADDLVQECLTRALVYIQDGRRIKDLRAYLFTVLRHVYFDELSRRRRQGTVVSIDAVSHRLSCPAGQSGRVECSDLSQAIDRLPVAQKEVILLIGLEGLSYQAAATVLDIPVGTVMSRLSRARATLRASLAGSTVEADALGDDERAALRLVVGE